MDSLQVFVNSTSETTIIWTVVVAICAVASIFITIGMLRATKKYTEVTEQLFLSSQRPYLGRDNHIINFHEPSKKIIFTIYIKNYGDVPAKNVSALIKLVINDVVQPVENNQSKNQIFFPKQSHPMDFVFNLEKIPDSFYEIQNGKLSLKIISEINYTGVTKEKYSTKEEEIYNHNIKSFLKEDGAWT